MSAPVSGSRTKGSDVVAEYAEIWAPASLSNLGPGFDVLGVALADVGDTIVARRADASGVAIGRVDPAGSVPDDSESNTAAVAAMRVLEGGDASFGVRLDLNKGVRPGSGLGSSAASAVAAAVATGLLCGLNKHDPRVLDAALTGESRASGAVHGDNVIPSLSGGFCLVNPVDPFEYRRIEVPGDVWIAVVLPDVPVLTREARSLLPGSVALGDAVRHAGCLAFLLDSLRSGDLQAVGRFIMSDEIVEPRRAQLLPAYSAIRAAALESGAFGCSLSGSGPAMFAIADSEAASEVILNGMRQAAGGDHVAGLVTTVDRAGARQVPAEVARPGLSDADLPPHGTFQRNA